MSTPLDLERRAERAGILPGYERAGGGWCVADDETRARLLEVLRDSPLPESSFGPEHPPLACVPVSDRIGADQAVGIWVNLYSLRGGRDLGVGSFSQLTSLVRWAGALGIDFVGLSPLHALRNQTPEISPYSPHSRLFLNPLYIDPWQIPELERSPALRAHVEDPRVARELAELHSAARIDHARSLEALERLFDLAFAQLQRERAAGLGRRAEELEQFSKLRDPMLTDYATFVCLERERARALESRDWRSWPPELRDPRSPAVSRFRDQHRDAIEREKFLQLEADRQLQLAQEAAQAAGMRIGLYRDLALSSLASSFDAWAFPGVFVTDVRLGAPPDAYAAGGQDWALPALDPRQLAGPEPHPYFAALLDTNLRHTGALRIDHVMGILRQYWIPNGIPASRGAYVRFPVLDLLHHIGLASRAHGAVIVGEDLGTVPPELAPLMDRAQMLSCRVFFFEREANGDFRRPEHILARSLLTGTTHDFPTLAGYVGRRDLEIQHRLGALGDTAFEAACIDRTADLERLRRYLTELGVWSDAAGSDSLELARALYLALRRTPAALLGIGLDNLTGETEPVNVPGFTVDAYPSWSRRMRMSVDEIARDDRIAEVLRCVRGAPSGRRTPG